MIALEVRKNGRRVCLAGARDLNVLNATVTAVGILGEGSTPLRPDEEGAEIFYQVGGLRSGRKGSADIHLTWKAPTPLAVGDRIELRIVETEAASRPVSRRKVRRRKA